MDETPLKVIGNQESCNLPNVILTNIIELPYYLDLCEYTTHTEIIDEIYSEVSFLDPWLPGTGVPSTAFCNLYRLHNLGPSEATLQDMIDHRDSPYIRGIGFLYLRFALPARDIWDWFEPYFLDQEEIKVGQRTKPTTIGKFLKNLLIELKYFDINLPRIPIPVHRQMLKDIEEAEKKEKPQAKTSAAKSQAARDEPKPKSTPVSSSSSSTSGKRDARSSSRSIRRSRSRSSSRKRSSRRDHRSRSSSRGRSSRRDRRSRSRSDSRRRSSRRDRERRRSRSVERKRRDRSRSKSRRERERSRDRSSRSSRSNRSRRSRSVSRSKSNSRSRSPKRSEDVEMSEGDRSAKTVELEKIKELYNASTTSGPKKSLSQYSSAIVPPQQEETILLGFRKS
eukprot:TRINITY_DN10800_c0_g1_i1.p1 TRINITY_DN10800_c0_g1~~TRINITY_DN10800_c0_g1_i1.p1  ORF type:complete len:394 (+),score=85.34 TRINITY_DN10800_c0_g1_i1:2-1183(+)